MSIMIHYSKLMICFILNINWTNFPIWCAIHTKTYFIHNAYFNKIVTWLKLKLSTESLSWFYSIEITLKCLCIVNPDYKIFVMLLLYWEFRKSYINFYVFLIGWRINDHTSILFRWYWNTDCFKPINKHS